MRIVEQSHEIMECSDDALQLIERAGRTCYKSEDKITDDSAERFVKMLIDRGHHAMLEFGWIVVKFITNRGVTHELVRHRPASYAQESTRYVNYGGDDIQFIKPVWYEGTSPMAKYLWRRSMNSAETAYKALLGAGWRPEQAREVLPNSLKTEIVAMGNTREWRHIFSLRCSNAAHPQMRALMRPLLAEVRSRIPVLFDDVGEVSE